MAISGHYKELVAGYKVLRKAEGITATRVFHDGDTSADDDLPEIGDLFDPTDETLSNLRAESIEETLFGGHPEKKVYTINYTTAPGATAGVFSDESSVEPNFLPISGTLVGEAVSIDGTKSTSDWVWEDGLETINQNFFKKIMTGNFKVTRKVAALELGTYAQMNGKINSEEMEIGGSKFGVELVLFNGVEYEEYRNDHGDRRWRVSFNFSVKALPAGDGTFYGWNYIYDDETNRFRRPYCTTDESEDYLYQTADLNTLLAPLVED